MKKLRYYFLVLNYLKQNQLPTRDLLLDYLKGFDIDISERTLYRALKELKSEFGILIKQETKNRGYFIAEDSYHNANIVLTYLKGLVTADILMTTNKSKYDLGRFVDREYTDNLVPIESFKIFFKAMTTTHKVSFTYFNEISGESKNVVFSPLFFKQYQERWYVIGFENKVLTVFELENLFDITILKERFKNDKGVVKDSYKEIIGLDCERSELEQVVLSFDTCQEVGLRSLPLHYSQILNNCKEDGRLLVTLRVRPNKELKKEILKFGSSVKIIKPEYLKIEIINELRAALELNM